HRFTKGLSNASPFGRGGSNVLAKVARGWQLGSAFSMQSGLPFTPSIGTDPANTGTSLRPDRLASGKVAERTLFRDFDTSAFKVPAQFTYGNSGRNILYARSFRNWDFIAFRNFALHEKVRLQFRSEFFNFTNTPAFAAPVSNIEASTVGRILSAGEPRDIQFALK